jgi:hypothetical protein
MNKFQVSNIIRRKAEENVGINCTFYRDLRSGGRDFALPLCGIKYIREA